MNYQYNYYKQFDGSFVYYIIERNSQKIVYLGETGNIVKRYGNHMSEGDRESTSAFHNWCKQHSRDKSDFDCMVLDLTKYDTLDADDRRIIEKTLQIVHRAHLISGSNRSPLNAYEIQRMEDINAIVHFDFKPYTQVKVERTQNKKVPSGGTDKTSIN